MKPETSCINIKALIDYVRARNPENLHLLWESLKGKLPEDEDPECFLTDPNNWISIEVCRDIMEQTKKATSDEMAVYKAGFESVRQRKLGYIERIFVRAFLTPKHAFRKVQKINDRFNKSKKVEMVLASNTHALVRLHWFKDLPLTRDFCLMNKGIYQAMLTVWDLPPARLEERVCFFEGGPYCEYEIRWEKKSLWKCFLRRPGVKREVLDSLIKEMERDKDLIRLKYEQVTKLNEKLREKVAYLLSLQEASQAVVSILDEQSLIQTIMNLLTSVIGFNRAILFLMDNKRKNLRFSQAVGHGDDSLEQIKDYEIPLDRMSNILARVAASGVPRFVKDVEKSSLRKGNIILKFFQPKNFAAAPLITRNKVIGVLAGEMPGDKADAGEPDLNLLMTFSNQIAIAIENARLYRDLERTYLSSLQSQKMEAIGTLTGGIAHDFNNILQAILGNISLLLYNLGEHESHYHTKLKQIESSAERASDLVRQLLTFSRKGESKLRPLRLNAEINEVRMLLNSAIPKMIAIELDLDPDLKLINADPVQVNQILMNLAINARDAMPDGGKLVIGAKNVTLDEEYCRTHSDLRVGEYVMLWASDTGQGMDKDVLDHIFEPFYTTKSVGKGTGLGLSTVYGIVKSHQGHIICESEPRRGTTFKIYFPALDKAVQKVCEEKPEELSIIHGTETILIVDDEEDIREYCKEMLGGYGYTVLTARSGEEALKVFVKERASIDLVVLNLVMVGMGGKRCLEELLKLDPVAKVLILTGYTVAGPVKEAEEMGAKGLLSKPVRPRQMAKVIREILDREPTPHEITPKKRLPGLRAVSSK
ncbi:MAG: response regulator [Desulfobacterales bacterium]|nr:response regulator [Desulfobacterales bacterium]